MNPRILQILTALTFLLIGLIYFFDVVPINIEIKTAHTINTGLSWLVVVLAVLTAALLIGDALKMKDED